MSWLLILAAAVGTTSAHETTVAQQKQWPAQLPVRFAVISDPHLYDPRLGDSGAAFEAYLAQDPKLLRESDAILNAAIAGVLQEHVKFMIVPGDLTKDGELRDHVLMARHLAKLEQHGIQVFVVPGNHDINNADAVRFNGDTTRPVAGVTPRLFRAIYECFGYSQAVDRDPSSLSYVAEPVRGLWLLAIDSCKYDESKQLGYPVVGGRIRPETMAWIQGVMQKAHAHGKEVIAFMHHGVNQHFFGEADLFPDFLLDDWASTSIQLAQTGLKVVFTGHYHSQDASYLVDSTMTPVSPLCDVATASLAAYPCAYRIATLDSENMLHIESRLVTAIQADTSGLPFQEYAFDAIFGPTADLAAARLESTFGLPPEQAVAIAPIVAQAIIANYAGDEAPSSETQSLISNLLSSPEPMHSLGMILWGLWTDLPPTPDSELTLPIALN